MKKIYNFIYCVDNTNYYESFCVDAFEFIKKADYVLDILDGLEVSPSQRVVNNILDFARKQSELES